MQLPLPALSAGAQHHAALHMLCSRAGLVSIDARLSPNAQPSQHSPTHAAGTPSKVRLLKSSCISPHCPRAFLSLLLLVIHFFASSVSCLEELKHLCYCGSMLCWSWGSPITSSHKVCHVLAGGGVGCCVTGS